METSETSGTSQAGTSNLPSNDGTPIPPVGSNVQCEPEGSAKMIDKIRKMGHGVGDAISSGLEEINIQHRHVSYYSNKYVDINAAKKEISSAVAKEENKKQRDKLKEAAIPEASWTFKATVMLAIVAGIGLLLLKFGPLIFLYCSPPLLIFGVIGAIAFLLLKPCVTKRMDSVKLHNEYAKLLSKADEFNFISDGTVKVFGDVEIPLKDVRDDSSNCYSSLKSRVDQSEVAIKFTLNGIRDNDTWENCSEMLKHTFPNSEYTWKSIGESGKFEIKKTSNVNYTEVLKNYVSECRKNRIVPTLRVIDDGIFQIDSPEGKTQDIVLSKMKGYLSEDHLAPLIDFIDSDERADSSKMGIHLNLSGISSSKENGKNFIDSLSKFLKDHSFCSYLPFEDGNNTTTRTDIVGIRKLTNSEVRTEKSTPLSEELLESESTPE
jgi:hypothetical protein